MAACARRWKQAIAAAAVLVASFLAPIAHAAGDLPLTAHAQAGQAFDGLRALHPEEMPRLADAQGGVVLRLLGDSTRFLDVVGYATEDIGALSEVCDRAKAGITGYMSFQAVQKGELDAKAVVRNIIEYQDELAVLQPFLARCIARQIPLAEAMLRKIGATQASQLRLGGLKRSQTSLLQLYAGLSACYADTRLGTAYCGLLDTMAELAPVHARALPLVSRAFVVRVLPPSEQLPAGSQRDAMRRILDAMSDLQCAGLCLLAGGDSKPTSGKP
ncbi:hypothetical protein WKW80_14805 [Variovorax humicola]|uniref:Uncharacterized protein n=1 Tax=Variovorax humicola TaxID=1769758 RepID=A0ABU8VZQ2_9BURK